GRARPRAAGLRATGGRLGAPSHADPEALALRLGRPPGRRDHGGPRTALRAHDARVEGAVSDAIVVGAGHNGLVAALLLARAGRGVTVVERRGDVGGLCAPAVLHPGYTVPGLLHDTTSVRRDLVAELGLARFGLDFEPEAPAVLAAHSAHRGVVLHPDPARPRAEREALHPRDGDAYARWRGFLTRIRGLVSGVLDRRPPRLRPRSLPEFWGLGRIGLGLKRLGNADMLELMRVTPMCVADWLQETFGDPLLPAALAAPALTGAFLGPRAAGS